MSKHYCARGKHFVEKENFSNCYFKPCNTSTPICKSCAKKTMDKRAREKESDPFRKMYSPI